MRYYNAHAREYIERTLNYDASSYYLPFLVHVPVGGHILDAGCGSGRDARVFLKRGYKVTAFDASKPMVKFASNYIGQEVFHMKFDDMRWSEEFEGIWSMASILHCPKNSMSAVFYRFMEALKPGGIWFMSFKLGNTERYDEYNRFYNDYSVHTLRDLLNQFPSLEQEKLWQDYCYKTKQAWVNALVLRKKMKVTNVAAAIIRMGKIILITQRPKTDKHLPGKWEFPGGKIEPGETPEISLAREIREELNIEIKVNHLMGISEYQYPHDFIRVLFYEVKYLHGDIHLQAHSHALWTTIPELVRYDFAPADKPFLEHLQNIQ